MSELNSTGRRGRREQFHPLSLTTSASNPVIIPSGSHSMTPKNKLPEDQQWLIKEGENLAVHNGGGFFLILELAWQPKDEARVIPLAHAKLNEADDALSLTKRYDLSK